MARPRTPLAKAKATGAVVIHPERFKRRKPPAPAKAIGAPFARMSAEQKAAWKLFVAELPWLNRSHRALLEVACSLRVRLRAGDVGVNVLQTYSAVLSKLGATPVDETKVSSSDEEEDRDEALFSRPR